jgi:hypothetical protein
MQKYSGAHKFYMKPIITLSFVSCMIIAGLSFTFHGDKKGYAMSKAAAGFAIVELFTSEGCSSCPPADDVMIKLAKEFPEHVYFLGYHVDYWDYIGWKDAFASADNTERQRHYASVFGLSSIYTPQMVVNGEKEFVGSREGQLRNTIQEELKGPASSVIELTAKDNDAGTITVAYRAIMAGKASLNIALVQLMATTNVKCGENNGHRLNHINIVREIKTIAASKEAISTVDFKIPSGLSSKDIKLIAFIQDKNNLKITGAAEAIIK